MTTKIQRRRINKMLHFLEEIVHPNKFDLGKWVTGNDPITMAKHPSEANHCNTAACVVGWMPHLFPRLAAWNKTGIYIHALGNIKMHGLHLFTNLLGIPYSSIIYDTSYSSGNPRPKTVARRIRKVCMEEGVDLRDV